MSVFVSYGRSLWIAPSTNSSDTLYSRPLGRARSGSWRHVRRCRWRRIRNRNRHPRHTPWIPQSPQHRYTQVESFPAGHQIYSESGPEPSTQDLSSPQRKPRHAVGASYIEKWNILQDERLQQQIAGHRKYFPRAAPCCCRPNPLEEMLVSANTQYEYELRLYCDLFQARNRSLRLFIPSILHILHAQYSVALRGRRNSRRMIGRSALRSASPQA